MSKYVDLVTERGCTFIFRLIFTALVILILTACGSGDSSKNTEDVPPTASDPPTTSDPPTSSDPPPNSGELLEPQAGEGFAQKAPFKVEPSLL